jgi:hypothetical protein
LKGKTKSQALSVNEAEHNRNPCCHLVARKGSGWELTNRGTELLDLIAW